MRLPVCDIILYFHISLLFFPHSLHIYIYTYIGKSIDPDGKKAVDDDHVERFIGMWDHWTGDTPTREAAIAAITPYVDSNWEDTFLHLLSLLLESLPNDVVKVDLFMDEWNGKYTEMFDNLLGAIRERERERAREMQLLSHLLLLHHH
jgi:hypothetical protein